MNLRNVLIVVAPLAWALSAGGAASAQQMVQCESRDYQYQFCATPSGVTRARLVEQRSRASCVEGRSWGYDRRGIWVSGGCEGVFEVQGYSAGPGNNPYRPGHGK